MGLALQAGTEFVNVLMAAKMVERNVVKENLLRKCISLLFLATHALWDYGHHSPVQQLLVEHGHHIEQGPVTALMESAGQMDVDMQER